MTVTSDQPHLKVTSIGLHLTIPDACWRPSADMGDGAIPGARLELAMPLFINGTGHHIGAALLKQDEDGELGEFRELADPDLEAEVMAGLQMIYEGVYEPTFINGKPYVVYMTPFAE